MAVRAPTSIAALRATKHTTNFATLHALPDDSEVRITLIQKGSQDQTFQCIKTASGADFVNVTSGGQDFYIEISATA